MPMSRYQRREILEQCFTDITLNTSNAIGNAWFFATADPGDDAGNSDTGTTANEAAVFSRNNYTSSWNFSTDPVTGHTRGRNISQDSGSVSGSAVLTYMCMSTSTSPNTKHNFYELMPYPVNVQSGDTIRYAPYRLSFQFSDVVSNYWANTQDGGLLRCLLSVISSVDGVNNMYMALSSTAPTPGGGNVTEPTGGGYARVLVDTSGLGISITIDSVDWGTNNIARARNNTNWTFPTATAPWSGLTHWALYSASTGGNMYFFGALDSTVNVLTGETPSFLTSDWQVDSGK